MTWAKSNQGTGYHASNIFFPAAVNMDLRILITVHVYHKTSWKNLNSSGTYHIFAEI